MKKIHLEYDSALKPYVRYCTLKKISMKKGERVTNKTQADLWPSLVVSLGPEIRRLRPGGAQAVIPRVAAFGAGQLPDAVEFRPGHQHLTFSFYPGKAHPFFGTSLSEFTDRAIPLSECWGQEGRILEERIAGMDSAAPIKDALEQALLRRLGDCSGYPAGALEAVRVGVDSKGRAPVKEMADAAGCSAEHLKRLFRQWVGLTPKVFTRIVRFQALCESLTPVEKPNWAGLSYDFGYSHQSHLIRDFQSFAGETPAEYYDSVVIPASTGDSPLRAFQPDSFPFHNAA